MPLAIELDATHAAVRRDDGKWYVINSATGEPVIPDGFDRLADASEAAEAL